MYICTCVLVYVTELAHACTYTVARVQNIFVCLYIIYILCACVCVYVCVCVCACVCVCVCVFVFYISCCVCFYEVQDFSIYTSHSLLQESDLYVQIL